MSESFVVGHTGKGDVLQHISMQQHHPYPHKQFLIICRVILLCRQFFEPLYVLQLLEQYKDIEWPEWEDKTIGKGDEATITVELKI